MELESIREKAPTTEPVAGGEAHTPLPWGYHERPMSDTFAVHGPKSQGIVETVGHVGQNEEEDARFIVEACNAYAHNQQTIRVLANALRLLYRQARKLEGEGFTGTELEAARNALAQLGEQQ